MVPYTPICRNHGVECINHCEEVCAGNTGCSYDTDNFPSLRSGRMTSKFQV